MASSSSQVPRDTGTFEYGKFGVFYNDITHPMEPQTFFDEYGDPSPYQGDYYTVSSFSSSSWSSSSFSSSSWSSNSSWSSSSWSSFSSSSWSSNSSWSSSSFSSSSYSSFSSSSSSVSSCSSSSSSMSLGPIWIINAKVIPAEFTSGTTICANYEFFGYQPESGSLIRWYVNNKYKNQYDDRICFPAIGSVGDVWFFTVTPSDGWQYSDTVESTPGVIIGIDSQITSVEIVPHNPQLTDSLFVVINGKVRKGISNRYNVRWFKNNIEMAAYRDTYSIPYTEVDIDDVFSVSVWLYGTSSSSSTSSNPLAPSTSASSFSSSSSRSSSG